MNVIKRLIGSSPASDLANLATRRETLEARKQKAIATLEAAREARKAALAGDADADLSKVTAAVRDAADNLETIDSVLADIGEETAAAEARLAAAQEADARSKATKELTAYADQFDNAAVALDTALKAVSKAYGSLVAAIPDTLAVVDIDGVAIPTEELARRGVPGLYALQDGYSAPARPHDLARLVLAEGLSKAVPSAFAYAGENQGYRVSLDRAADLGVHPRRKHDDLSELQYQSAREAASLLVSNRLRDRAAAIATGELPPLLADRSPVKPVNRKQPEKTPAEVMVFATRSFAFRIRDDRPPTLCGALWAHPVPADAADVAVRKGVALRLDTPEGERAFEAVRAGKGTRGVNNLGTIHIDDCQFIGVIRATPDDEDE